MDKVNNASLDLEIARQCAPVLADVKSSNLLILGKPAKAPKEAFFREAGISTYLLYQGSQKAIWLVYRREELEDILFAEESQAFLKEWGYEGMDMEQMLMGLAVRFGAYRDATKDAERIFPHEMGIFLGYPLGDVKGFIVHGGKNYLYSGYWKVYENVEETRKKFQLFAAVKQSLIQAVTDGMGIWGAVAQKVPQPV